MIRIAWAAAAKIPGHAAAVICGPMPRRTLAGLTLCFALFCWAGAVLWLSSFTPRELPEVAFLFSDKLEHAIAYAIGGWIAATALRVLRPATPAMGPIVLAVAVIAVFGVLDEYLQTFTPGRTGGDIYDWFADVLGAIAGASLSLTTQGRLERLL